MAVAGNLIERPVIKIEFEPKYDLLVQQFSSELDEAKVVFRSFNIIYNVLQN